MSYSARRGFSNGSQNAAGSRRQAELQQRISKIQADMDAAQAEMEQQEFTASTGGGAVKATVNGGQKLLSLIISPEAAEGGDMEMLQDLIISAVNEAGRQAAEAMDQRMKALGSGMNLPGLGL